MLSIHPTLLVLIAFCLSLFSLGAKAVSVEAIGYAAIFNNDLVNARKQAIADASAQASMQAAAHLSTNQQVKDGILEIDEMQITSLGKVSNVEVIREARQGNTLIVTIRADVTIQTACENGQAKTHKKRLAFTAFPIQAPLQANLGRLGDAPQALSRQLALEVADLGPFTALKATHLNLFSNIQDAASRQLDDGALTTIAANVNHLDTQYIVSGVIRDMSMVDPRIHTEKNYFVDLYNRMDYRSDRYMRNFEVDVFVHDGFSGALLFDKTYKTQGTWNLRKNLASGFDSPTFREQEYGIAVGKLVRVISKELSDTLTCQPLTARINQVDNTIIWISNGQDAGIKVGERFRVLHRSTLYDAQMRPSFQLSDTGQTLRIDRVHPAFAIGHLINPAQQQNILPGDVVIAESQ